MDLEHLANRLAAFPELEMRIKELAAYMSGLDDAAFLLALEQIFERAFEEAVFRDLLLVWSLVMQGEEIDARHFYLKVAAVEHDILLCQYLMETRIYEFGHSDKKVEKSIDYGVGRPLSLGERKTLARTVDRKLMARALHDPDPSVIELLLGNPKVTESDVVRLCARRPASYEVLQRVYCHPRWITKAAIKRALALNPALPLGYCLLLLPQLLSQDRPLVLEQRELPDELLNYLQRFTKPSS
ncbi:MAG: hypothetical protein IPJ88_07405 [Myxococcales bacterium]|nr:MAG: hypothetical protein IPJ88_07405 [Myxococcales bacterium]